MKSRKNTPEAVPVDSGTWTRVLKCEEEAVLTLSMRWPKFPEEASRMRRAGRYYRQVSECWKAHWEGPVYRDACAALAAAREASRPFHPWEAKLDFTVTCNERGLLSLYLDAYEYTGGAHGITVRQGDAWDLCSGFPRPLASFFPPRSRWRRTVLCAMLEEGRRRVAAGDTLYFDDWERTLVTGFDPCRFYLTREGIAVFYPLYTIAPYAEGIPVFTVPLPECCPEAAPR